MLALTFTGTEPVEKGTGEPLQEQWEKMSKSKYNGYDPQVIFITGTVGENVQV